MAQHGEVPLVELASAATEVAEGHYDSAKRIFELTKPGSYSEEINAVAEAFGMMAVKVEAREFRLERALDEIRRKNVQLEEASRTRSEFGLMATFIIISLCLYSLALAFLQSVMKMDINARKAVVECISFGFLILQIGNAVLFITKHKPHPSDYGWTLRNWKTSLRESLVYCVLTFVGMLGLKWVLVHYTADFHGKPIINWTYWGGWVTVLSYLFVAPAQELLARGFLQNSTEKFLVGKRRTLLAIILTSAQFGVVHLHFSFSTGLVAMISGLLFGGIFARQRTILGVSLLHFVLGTLAFGPLQLIGF